MSITYIRLVYDSSPDSLYGGADLDQIDQEASQAAYTQALQQALQEAYPEAEIQVEAGSYPRTVIDSPDRMRYITEGPAISWVTQQVWASFDWLITK